LAFLRLFVYTTFLYTHLLNVTLLHLSQDLSNWSPPSSSRSTFQKFSKYFHFPKCPNFQCHTKSCFKFSTLIVSSINLIPICWWKGSCFYSVLLLPWQYWI
jgi:hypothetical protein